MANLFDYLLWRADVPLDVDPFNEVDNLLLAELAYTDLQGIVPGDGTEIALPDARKLFFAIHDRAKINADRSFTARAPLLMDAMAAGDRFRETRLCRYVDDTDAAREIQMAAVTFRLPHGQTYVAFRGTDGTLVGWREDFNISFLSATEGQRRAVNYLEMVARDVPGPLMVGGHSKGGNLAVYAAAFCGSAIQTRIEKVYSNDGPGFRREIIEALGYERILSRIVSIVPDTSMIGLLMNSKAVHRVIRSDATGILQHDGFSWQVRRNRFEEATLAPVSEMVEQTLSDWLEQMDDATRASFTDTVFSLFEATGKESFASISNDKWKSAESIVNAALTLPKERRQELLSLLKRLGTSGSQTVLDHIRDRLNSR